MDSDASQPGTPVGGPLQSLTPDGMNKQRDSISVHDKISQFNSLSNSMSIAAQSRQLERRTADAALKRAMLGREEAEAELKKYREELKAMRKTVDEGKERERRVGERLETVMENYGRAKETHAHTQALWEKEIRRARKENFKTQSSIVKLQEELKSSRSAVRSLEENLEREKERTRVREQEAFTARYQIVGVQEQLEQALAQIKVVEQERDAFKTAAKNEEVARIAAEGRIPLPASHDPLDEFASPPKKGIKKRKVSREEPRYSLSTFEIESSAAAEMEIEELTLQVQWERQRAERAEDMVDFLKAECEMHCCACSKTKTPRGAVSPQQQTQLVADEAVEVATLNPMLAEAIPDKLGDVKAEESNDIPDTEAALAAEPKVEPAEAHLEPPPPRSKKGPRNSTVFYPKEGIFRTVSEVEAAAMQARGESDVIIEPAAPVESEESEESEPPTPTDEEDEASVMTRRTYARTPSAEPPAFALLVQERASLLSLLNAPHNDAREAPIPRIPTVSDPADGHPKEPQLQCQDGNDYHRQEEQEEQEEEQQEEDNTRCTEHQVERSVRMAESVQPREVEPRESLEPRPHTSATLYSVTTTTTSVPVHDEKHASSYEFGEKLRTPSSSSNASFDLNNPALTPTMTREQALAKIRERRGRAKSAAQGAATPHKKMIQGKERRDLSAPTNKTGTSSSRSRH